MQRRRTAVAVPQTTGKYSTVAERFATETYETKLFARLVLGLPSALLILMFWMDVFA